MPPLLFPAIPTAVLLQHCSDHKFPSLLVVVALSHFKSAPNELYKSRSHTEAKLCCSFTDQS